MKIFLGSLSALLLFLVSSVHADDSEVWDLIERCDAEPYSKTGAQLDVFRQLLAKSIDMDDELERQSADLESMRTSLEAVHSFLLSQEEESALSESELLLYGVMLLAGIWGSVLYISFVQKGFKV
ncbi:MAG: hypothetical protein J6J31_12485 [Thermoguttaceae bacterium]|nr:hypothetical protein [Thermoguttaceae bacterium]